MHKQIQKTSFKPLSRKHQTDPCHKLYGTNHDNIVKFWRIVGDTIRFQFHAAVQVINLSTNRFCAFSFI